MSMKITVRENRTVHEADGLVGKQQFTYAELEKAWDELKKNVENDPYNSKNLPSQGYDIRNGYDTTDGYDPSENQWDMDFSLEAITKELEEVPAMITAGDLEVYYNDNGEANSDEHGIYIIDGKIDKVY